MSVAVTYTSKLTVVETLADTLLSSNDKGVTHNGLDVNAASYNAGSAVPVTKVASFEKALSSGAGTIDLRALVGTNGATIDGNGLKVQFVKFKNKTGNANPITITFGAANPYNLFGSAFVIVLAPGQEFLANLNEQAPDIGSSAKNIDISGTGSQVLQCEIVMG